MFNLNNVSSFISKAATKLEEVATRNTEKEVTITDAPESLTPAYVWNQGTEAEVAAQILSQQPSTEELIQSLTDKGIQADASMSNTLLAEMLAAHWVDYRTARDAKLEERLASDETSGAENTNTKEEESPMEKEFTVEELAEQLVEGGVNPEVAKVTAEAVAEAKAKATEEKKAEVKPWFKRAVDGMTLPRKKSLIGELMMQKYKTKDAKEIAEIEAEIERLASESGDDRFKTLMNGYIVKSKGWTVTATGQVAEFAYLSGDATEKGVRKATAAVGKTVKWTGEKIATGGQKIEESAPAAGKIARKPFDAVGDGLNIVSGNKPMPKLPKSSKATN